MEAEATPDGQVLADPTGGLTGKCQKMYLCSVQGVRGIPAVEIIAEDGDDPATNGQIT